MKTAQAYPLAPNAADPSWASPYVPGSVPDWKLWHEPTVRGMMADLSAVHPCWDAVWWRGARRLAPSGADEHTWYAVWPHPLGQTDTHPCVHFCSWKRADEHGNRVAGAPLRIAAYPGLWRDGSFIWSFCCHWQSYAAWRAPLALERAWAAAAACSCCGAQEALPLDGEEHAALAVAEGMRSGLGWTKRSAILAALPDDGPNEYIRSLVQPVGTRQWADFRDARIAERAERLCWERAEDDLPWRPAAVPIVEADERPARRPGPDEHPRARQMSFFELVAR